MWIKGEPNPADEDNYNYIDDNIAVGSVAARENPVFKAIISVMPASSLKVCTYNGRITPPHTDNWLLIPIHDGEPGLKNWIDRGVEFINKNLETKNTPILIHCHAGISRSTSMAIAYYMSTGMSFGDACWKVGSRRLIMDPWHGFIKEIKEHFKS